MTTATAFDPYRLHRILGAALAVVTAVFVVRVYLGFAPKMPGGAAIPLFMYGPSAVALGLIAVALLLGILAAIGYFLTSAPLALIPIALVFAAFWMCGPNTFAKA